MNAGLRQLLSKLHTFKVKNWVSEYGEMGDRDEVSDLDSADVASSWRKNPWGLDDDPKRGHHIVAIDLDIPAYCEASSTPGHGHLYIDVDLPWFQYERLLNVLSECGIVEEGYARVSIERGHTDLRLPWVKKQVAAMANPSGIPVEDLRF